MLILFTISLKKVEATMFYEFFYQIKDKIGLKYKT